LFELHSHGEGPQHYATFETEVVFEIYPATEKFPVTLGTRIGFEVESCQTISALLIDKDYTTKSMPKDSPWGMRAVFSDPGGHSVEVVSSE